MRAKLWIFLVGVLALIQIGLYTRLLKDNARKWDQALQDVDMRLTTHQSRIIEVDRKVVLMEKDKRNVPEAILEGVKDPESKFLQFMDYLENSELGTMHGQYEIANKPVIKYRPVPLQKTDFAIKFEFLKPDKLESVLGYLLNKQQDYPLKVNHLVIKRIPKSKPQVFLDVSLLLPAKVEESPLKNISGSTTSGT